MNAILLVGIAAYIAHCLIEILNARIGYPPPDWLRSILQSFLTLGVVILALQVWGR